MRVDACEFACLLVLGFVQVLNYFLLTLIRANFSDADGGLRKPRPLLMEVAKISSCGLNNTLRILVSAHPHILLISSAVLEIIHTHYCVPQRPCGAITHLTTNPVPVRPVILKRYRPEFMRIWPIMIHII